MSVLCKLWDRVTRKNAVRPKIQPLPLKNQMYGSNRTIMAEIEPIGPKRYDTIEEALKHRHTASPSSFYKGIPVRPLIDAHSKELIEKFIGKHHKGAKNAHRIMIFPEPVFPAPSYNIEEALRARNHPNHPINRTFLRVPKPTFGETFVD